MERIEGIGQYKPQNARDRQMWDQLSEFCAHEPQAFGRDPLTSHVTGSAFVLSQDLQSVLLTHHRKLDRWLQLGGHCDGIADAGFVALKEAYEESGLTRIAPLSAQVFDVDIHEIPANSKECAHLHYDVRYLFRAVTGEISVSDESHALEWVPLQRLHEKTDAASVLVLRDKLPAVLNNRY
ncbi:NUDIX hydrolase [Phaeobacter sp. PT47_59]|uniref:NUDIX hydrolase n=1 Tax=Phaeobacter sp. PT47_59 TaxID=3029979 RepID=UPI0023807402|nr:NUDIX hydrolase [Phaeobacter sp. PT47_59]MDE4172696.1 NUDIX hydrolase [Phaeobacter sp. PT47_59]